MDNAKSLILIAYRLLFAVVPALCEYGPFRSFERGKISLNTIRVDRKARKRSNIVNSELSWMNCQKKTVNEKKRRERREGGGEAQFHFTRDSIGKGVCVCALLCKIVCTNNKKLRRAISAILC